jgi:hypothetical protein
MEEKKEKKRVSCKNGGKGKLFGFFCFAKK